MRVLQNCEDGVMLSSLVCVIVK